MVAAYWQTYSPCQLAWSVSLWPLAAESASLHELSELSQWLCRADSAMSLPYGTDVLLFYAEAFIDPNAHQTLSFVLLY